VTERTITNATLVLPEGETRGAVRLVDGWIAEVLPQRDLPGGLDLGGDYLLPGVVDIHTDHMEKHVFPRRHVLWDPMTAAMAHDAQMIGSGTTTVFDALVAGSSIKRPERREILAPCIEALERLGAAGMLRARHLVHLRCEISDPETPALLETVVGHPLVTVASVMDHTPGDRQSPDVERYITRQAAALDLSLEDMRARTAALIERSARVARDVQSAVAAQVLGRGLRLMSHDDATREHVREAHAEGITISEFPTTLEAAREARKLGMATVAGAPNFLRGGSQSGNVAVRDLLAEMLVDMLSSDYVPRSPIDCAFAIADDPSMPYTLPEALALVTVNPARAAGLTDRGAMEAGQRADLIHVGRREGRVHVARVWVDGRLVVGAPDEARG
jgi:alpha-D-ribose 1-methylphosphonate 5-triphosphate diphosphatase